MNIPHNLVNTIKSLYSQAKTTVILNGEMSRKFQVTRGVHQGDPLSCLLFNLAIKPMSHILRTTDKLLGLNINTPDNHPRAILALFANDTTVFLSKSDNPETLFKILDKWCSASGAKFNRDKTVIIPVGLERYRKEVTTNCSPNSQNEYIFPESIHILKDGETTHCLGAQVGNNPTGNEPWPRIIDDIEKSLSQWNKAYPSIDGC